MELKDILLQALRKKDYLVFHASSPPPIPRRGYVLTIPIEEEELPNVPSKLLPLPSAPDYGDMIYYNGSLFIVVPESAFDYSSWIVVDCVLRWNGHRYFNRCLQCGGERDEVCKTCGV